MITTLSSNEPIAAPPMVTLTVNGQKIHAAAGQTILQAAATAGIHIPTLCNHPSVSAYGGCRMCVVEIERVRALQPSCTYPIAEGLVVQTETPRVVESRKFVLEMLFSERNHYCMFCPAAGGEHTSDCELQQLAYRYGMTHWQYSPKTDQRWPVDATNRHFVVDSSRCILCRRCIRACGELVACHTLGVQQRGTRTMVSADDGVPLAESTCVNCGTCLQICPTGSLMDRGSSFCGHEADIQRTRTTCLACGVGCPIETVIRLNRVLRVDGVWDAENHGVLCEDGRFKVLEETSPRLHTPLIRRNGDAAAPCTWDEALSFAAENLTKNKKVAGMITPRSTNESLVAFLRMFHDIFRSDQVSLTSGQVPPLDIGTPATVADLDQTDLIVVIGGDPWNYQKVLAYLSRRAVDRGASLIIANAEPSGLEPYAGTVVRLTGEAAAKGDPHLALRRIYHLRPDRLAQVRQAIDAAKHPVVMHGPNLDDQIVQMLHALPRRTRLLPLVRGANAMGAAILGLKVTPVAGDALYAVVSDEQPDGVVLPPAKFTVVQSSYRNAWTERADVVLPSKIWFEKQGHITNFAGRRLGLTRSVNAPEDILSDWATMFMLSVKMGKPLSCITVAEGMLSAAL